MSEPPLLSAGPEESAFSHAFSTDHAFSLGMVLEFLGVGRHPAGGRNADR
jgi:hypothetical protein